MKTYKKLHEACSQYSSSDYEQKRPAFLHAYNTHGGAMPMACRLARATRLCGPVFPKAPRIPGFIASVDWILACSSAALRAFSIASFMKLAA